MMEMLYRIAVWISNSVTFWEVYMGGIVIFSVITTEKINLTGVWRFIWICAFVLVWHPIAKIIAVAYKRAKESAK